MLLYFLLAAPLVAALLTVFASGKDGESSFRLGLVSLLLLSGPIAWVVGLAAVTVAVLFLLLEFLF